MHLQIFKKKDLDKITVQDISNQADINRGTFYLHYKDKYMLLTDMEDECISQIWSSTQFNQLDTSTPEIQLMILLIIFLTKVLQHISDNMDFYHTILQLERKSRLEEKFIP